MRLRPLVAVLGMLSAARVAGAQELRGTIRDSASQRPVAGAVISLLGTSNAVLGRVLSNERGEYRIPGASSGQGVRVQHIGFRPRDMTFTSEIGGNARLDVALLSVPTLLDPVTVVASAVCRPRRDADQAFALLQQARAGLLAVTAARQSTPGTMVRLQYSRHMDGTTERILDQQVRVDSVHERAVSFAAERSAEHFVRQGFAINSDSGQILLGPDADILLDESFAQGYCFRIMDPDNRRPNQIGLGFAPASLKGSQVGIDGALWIDTVARTLRDVEYRYVGFVAAASMHPGGRSSFREMGNGVVLIDSWMIRSPDTEGKQSLGSRARALLTGNESFSAIESGGEVAEARWPDGTTWYAPLGSLKVSALNLNHVPTAGLVIQLANTDYFGIVDGQGELAIPSVLPGPYNVALFDQRLMEVDLAYPPPKHFVAIPDSTLPLSLVARSLDDYILDRCQAERLEQGAAAPPPDSSVLVIGRVTTPAGRPAAGAGVSIARFGGPTMRSVTAGSDGVFTLCLPPTWRHASMEVRARGADGAEALALPTIADAVTIVRLRLAPRMVSQAAPAPRASKAPVAVRGVVFDSLHGAALPGARVALIGSGRATVSDARGRFAFDNVAPGPHTFAIQHDVLDAIGLSGASARADVSDGRDTIRVSVPSFTALWRAACRGSRVPDDSGIVFGTVRTASGQRAPAAVTVSGWTRVGAESTAPGQPLWRVDAATDANGDYAVCGVPLSSAITVRASTDSARSGLIDLMPSATERIQRRDLVIAQPGTDSIPGTVVGVVFGDRGPIAGAVVHIEGGPSARSATDGRFLLSRVAPGSREVEARSVGRKPVSVVADVTARDTARIELTLAAVAPGDSLRLATDESTNRRLASEFTARRTTILGTFMDSTTIRAHRDLASVFKGVEGVKVWPAAARGVTFEMNGLCRDFVWVDRVRLDSAAVATVTGTMRPEDLAAIEVYKEGEPPDPFNPTHNSLCGAVVIWTKRRLR